MPFPAAGRSGPWAMLPKGTGPGRVPRPPPSLCTLPLLGRRRRGRREWAWGVQTGYVDGDPLEAGVGPPLGGRDAAGTGAGWDCSRDSLLLGAAQAMPEG